jgi:hypothetical protein
VKSVKNFRYVEKTSAECNEDSYLAILHLSRVELHCKLEEKLHRVTWPLLYSDILRFDYSLEFRHYQDFGHVIPVEF